MAAVINNNEEADENGRNVNQIILDGGFLPTSFRFRMSDLVPDSLLLL